MASAALRPSPGEAAIRLCQPSISSGLKEAPTEPEARKMAMDSWLAQAGALGEGYTRWQIASEKRFNCSRTAKGSYQCLAVGQPCTVTQVPPSPSIIQKKRSPGVDA